MRRLAALECAAALPPPPRRSSPSHRRRSAPRRSLRFGVHCKPKAGTNNVFSIGVIPSAAPFDGPGVAKICKAPDGRVFLLVNFSRRAIIKFFGRITDTAEV